MHIPFRSFRKQFFDSSFSFDYEFENDKTFDDYRIAGKLTVAWKLPEGDFTWLNLEITDLEMNLFELYP
jgi:hypothetical protein